MSRVFVRTARRRAASAMAISYITIIMTRSAVAPTRATAELHRVQWNPSPFIAAISIDIDKSMSRLLPPVVQSIHVTLVLRLISKRDSI